MENSVYRCKTQFAARYSLVRQEGVDCRNQQANDDDGDDNRADGIGRQIALAVAEPQACAVAQRNCLFIDGADKFFHIVYLLK